MDGNGSADFRCALTGQPKVQAVRKPQAVTYILQPVAAGRGGSFGGEIRGEHGSRFFRVHTNPIVCHCNVNIVSFLPSPNDNGS